MRRSLAIAALAVLTPALTLTACGAPGDATGEAAASTAATSSAVPAAAPSLTGTSVQGAVVTASAVTGLDPAGQLVEVTGTGFDETKGIYVAFCVAPEDGQPPTPCGGGVDTAGTQGLSHWVSSSPPPYGEGLAEPFGPGGAFDVELRVSPSIGDIDCTVVVCGIATRADHTRTSDRSQDVFIPVTFAPSGAA